MKKTITDWKKLFGVKDHLILDLGEPISRDEFLYALGSEFRALCSAAFFFKSRYNDLHCIIKTEMKGVYMALFGGPEYVRYGMSADNPETIAFVDPPGGPMISVGTFLSEIAYGAPRSRIRQIEYSEGEVFLVV